MDSPMPLSLVEMLDAPGIPPGGPDQLHPLTDIPVLSVLTMICGADSFVAIALFGQLHEAWLRTFLELPHGIPPHDTLGRVFARLDASGFEEAFELTAGQGLARQRQERARLPRPGSGPWTRCDRHPTPGRPEHGTHALAQFQRGCVHRAAAGQERVPPLDPGGGPALIMTLRLP